ncbi:MAG TPA: hypothetical protein PK830_04170 [Candidatus Atribacteria bacterium]|nr:hypothetical protein [Candidatus Atribacteria bacterium]HPT78282.1 hypothetical protein [Candidatus Atribacteria bacterium]
MSGICPVCNGLYSDARVCYICGLPMVQLGRLEDLSGPYSPYMAEDTFLYNNSPDLTGDNCCIHVYKCEVCGNIRHGSIRLITV